MAVCASVGIQLGCHISPAIISGISICPEDVARWFGIVPATFSTMHTEFKMALVVHCILRQHGPALLSPADNAFHHLLERAIAGTWQLQVQFSLKTQ
jgi:hypothetical protein